MERCLYGPSTKCAPKTMRLERSKAKDTERHLTNVNEGSKGCGPHAVQVEFTAETQDSEAVGTEKGELVMGGRWWSAEGGGLRLPSHLERRTMGVSWGKAGTMGPPSWWTECGELPGSAGGGWQGASPSTPSVLHSLFLRGPLFPGGGGNGAQRLLKGRVAGLGRGLGLAPAVLGRDKWSDDGRPPWRRPAPPPSPCLVAPTVCRGSSGGRWQSCWAPAAPGPGTDHCPPYNHGVAGCALMFQDFMP